ncbi:MAG TPA: transcription factor S [Methanomassiliicoccales archaeon]|nr:transcription factor S [Methanomassiliicoccales archaeon]
MFCPDCKSLMFPKTVEQKRIMSCKKCGKEVECDNKKKECFNSHTKKSCNEMLVVETHAATLPKTKVECEKCGHNEAFWVLRQTRAADEPETKIYRCVKCQHSWREY